ncbi:MAG: type II secretion system F family protein [Candidatus Hydrogenedentes bacterium]|nr:type II secretion system F family protein [Candidatus Hydrogenedentota bacterium]
MPTNAERRGEGMKRVRRGGPKQTIVTSSASVVDDEIIAAPAAVVRPAGPSRNTAFFSTARKSDVTAFLRQLIMLLQAGTPILKSLQTLSARGRSGVRGLVRDICQYVEAGNPLWQAFERHSAHFDVVFINNIKASEASGTLITVLERLVSYREKRAILKKRVQGAMLYPVILLAMCLLVMLVITKFVIPSFADMFEKMSIQMNSFTLNFIAVSTFLGKYWLVGVGGLVVLYLIYKLFLMRNSATRPVVDYIKLKIPVVGPIVQQNAIVELTRTLALLLKSGLSIMVTLDLVKNSISNRAVANTLDGVRSSVERGGGLEQPLRSVSGVIPEIVTDMLVTGEESGQLDQIAEQIANTYEEEVTIRISTLGDALIPIVVLIIGVVVLMLAFAMGGPLLDLMNSLGAGGGGAGE